MLKYFKKKPLDGATAGREWHCVPSLPARLNLRVAAAGYLVLHQSSLIRSSGLRAFSIQTRDALINFMADDEVGPSDELCPCLP